MGRQTLSAYYLTLMDRLYPICPDCLFLGEGTGATSLAANWGAPVHAWCGFTAALVNLQFTIDAIFRSSVKKRSQSQSLPLSTSLLALGDLNQEA